MQVSFLYNWSPRRLSKGASRADKILKENFPDVKNTHLLKAQDIIAEETMRSMAMVF